MKVLWFSNTPSLAAITLNDKMNIGGWIASLEKEIVKVEGIELGVAFHYGNTTKKQFSVAETQYFSFPYPVIDKGHKRGILSRWMHKIEPDNIVSNYLEIVEAFKPDIIHIFGTEQAFGLIIDKVNIPVVIQIQGNLSVYERKWDAGLSNYSILINSKIKTLLFAYGIWHEFFKFKKRAKRERMMMKKCSFFIGRTDWDKRITQVMSPGRKYFHCDEMLREEFYNSPKWNNFFNKEILVHSTLSSVCYKGIEIILEIAEIIEENKLQPIKWQIAGLTGNEEIIQIVEKCYCRKFKKSNVVFLGKLSPNELLKAMLEANCYVHPSHIENSPNSVCEAMLLGLPVIATYAGGTSSLLSDGVEGLLVQDGDPYSMLGSIYELNQNDILNKNVSENAKSKASERHKAASIIKDLLNVYNTVGKGNKIIQS